MRARTGVQSFAALSNEAIQCAQAMSPCALPYNPTEEPRILQEEPAMQVTVQEAQTRLPELLAEAAAGHEVVITDDDGKSLAKLIPSPPPAPIRRMGWLKGKMAELKPGDPFFDPLPEEELRLWNGEGS